jgi:DNA-binding transcriptional regulator LsrR (DeoR family)
MALDEAGSTGEDAGGPRGGGFDLQLATRAAWYYYVENMTQADIAKRLGINRVRVNRLLAQCLEDGIVQIRINTPLAACVALEERLRRRFGLAEAVVVPAPADELYIRQALAMAAGTLISDRIGQVGSIGIGWGRTLRMSLQFMQRRAQPGLKVVSLIGGLTRASVMNTYDTAAHMADLFGAVCFYIAGPAFTDSEATRDLFLAQPMLQDVVAEAKAVDLAVVSVGALGHNTTMQQLGLVSDAEIVSLRQAGAVGDLLAHWIDRDGKVVDHPINRRVLAIGPEDLRNVPSVVLVSGGLDKVEVIRAALRGGYVNMLVVDESTAAAVLAKADDGRADDARADEAPRTLAPAVGP